MADLCFITYCMGRLAFLRQTLGRMVEQADCSCVVVDWSCPDGTGAWVEANHPPVRVVRVPGQRTFHVNGARNAGARVADAPWLAFIDADILLAPEFVKQLRPALRDGSYYRAHPSAEGICGSVICTRADYERSGGYDNTFHGYGDNDHDFFDALEFAGVRPAAFAASMVRHLPHDDVSRTKFYAMQQRALISAINRVYRVVKWELARERSRLLGEDERRSLYASVNEHVGVWLKSIDPPYAFGHFVKLVIQELRLQNGQSLDAAGLARIQKALYRPLAVRRTGE